MKNRLTEPDPTEFRPFFDSDPDMPGSGLRSGDNIVHNKTELANNLRLITERLDQFKSVAVGIWVGVGSRDERPEEGGISHFIEHMIFKGTQKRTALDIAKEIDQIGGMSNAFTSKEFTCFHAKVMSDHLPVVTELLTDIFLNSRFSPEDFERERQVILQEIRMVEDTPDELVHVLFSENLFPSAALGRPVMGSIETVSSIDRDAIYDYLDRTYRPPRIVISAAGDVEHGALVDLLEPSFGALPTGNNHNGRNESSKGPGAGLCLHYKELEQVHVCLGGLFPGVRDDRRFPAALLNIILGGNMSSRLFQEIRENRGLAYSVYSFFSAYLDVGMMGVYAGVDPSNTGETTRLILAELEKLRDGRLDEEELAAAREHLKGSIILGSESVDNRMTRLAKNEITYGRRIDFEEIIEKVDQVTVDQVTSVARDYLRPEQLNLTVLGPAKESDLPLDMLAG